jgi:hypothetical protein
MSEHEPELQRMLDLYRDVQSPDAAARARVWQQVESSVAPPAAASQAAPASALGGGTKLVLLGSAIAAGGALWLLAATNPAEPRTQPQVEPPEQRQAAPDVLPVATDPPVPSPSAGAGAPAARLEQRPARAERPTPAPSSSLAEELELVSAAQTALDSGDGARALSLLRRHQRRFPAGALAEEREAGRVEALCALGRRAQAQHAAARFIERFPGSPRATRLRQACMEPQP